MIFSSYFQQNLTEQNDIAKNHKPEGLQEQCISDEQPSNCIDISACAAGEHNSVIRIFAV
jgi:hypothetical protein